MPSIGNSLTADHLNYLIWRHLQEQGQAQAAVTLQRDWRNGQDPDSLPFARSIRSRSLVQLVHKGLLYYDTEQVVRQKQHGIPAQPYFGIEADGSTTTPNGNTSEEATMTESRISPRSRKHGRNQTANGLGLQMPPSAPPAKRMRRSNGTEPSGHTNGDVHSMDIDQNGDADHARPEPISRPNSPGAEEETRMEVDVDGDDDAPAPESARIDLPVTNGPSVGVQSDKVADLGTETLVLTLPPGKHVTHIQWNPQDPCILATAGDALCRIWTTAKNTPVQDGSGSPSPYKHIDMLDSLEGSLVSTIEWSPNGDTLALATRRGLSLCVGLVTLWSKHGKAIDEIPVSEDMVLTFRWSPSGNYLLGITNSGAGTSTLIIWHARDPDSRSDFHVPGIVRDAAWIGEEGFRVCGHRIIQDFTFDGSTISEKQSHAKDDSSHSWTHIRFDAITRTTAMVAEDDGTLAIMDDANRFSATEAHKAEITALAYQPIANPSSYSSSSPRLLATSALDCSIKLWDAQRPFKLVTSLSLGSTQPPMAISFTADGYLVAAANWNRVMIWNPEKGGVPMATWKGESGEWQSSSSNIMDQDSGIGEEEEIPPHSLSWDANGGKLAYGLRNQVAILNFRSSPSR